MMSSPKSILVPVDGSDASLRAVELGGLMAHAFRARLTLLSVVEHNPDDDMSLGKMSADDRERHLDDEADPILDAAQARLDAIEGSPHVTCLTRYGDPDDEIVAAVAALDIDHIVMGTRGLGNVAEMLLGSVSEDVKRRVRIPITLVH